MDDSWPLAWGRRTYIMGIINLTPDSFSGDGLMATPPAILGRATEMLVHGADIIDVGGESTRPGHEPIDIAEELIRVLPAVPALSLSLPIPVSVDTRKSEVANRACAAGANIVNDVSGLADSNMAATVASAGVGLIIVHNDEAPSAGDVILEIARNLERRIEVAVSAGVNARSIAIDPGLGIGKDWRANLEIVRRLGELRCLGLPIVIGPSRKGTIGRVLGVDVRDRIEGTAALVALAIERGVDVVRVHDVRAMSRVAGMTDALVRE